MQVLLSKILELGIMIQGREDYPSLESFSSILLKVKALWFMKFRDDI